MSLFIKIRDMRHIILKRLSKNIGLLPGKCIEFAE